MSSVLHLQYDQREVRNEADEGEYSNACGSLCSYLLDGLVDWLEKALTVDLSPLRLVTYEVADTQELIEDYDYSRSEAQQFRSQHTKNMEAAWQSPDHLIAAIHLVLDRIGYRKGIGNPEAVAMLKQSPFACYYLTSTLSN